MTLVVIGILSNSMEALQQLMERLAITKTAPFNGLHQLTTQYTTTDSCFPLFRIRPEHWEARVFAQASPPLPANHDRTAPAGRCSCQITESIEQLVGTQTVVPVWNALASRDRDQEGMVPPAFTSRRMTKTTVP